MKRLVGGRDRARRRIAIEDVDGLACVDGTALFLPGPIDAAPSEQAALAHELDHGVQVTTQEETGEVGFIGSTPALPIDRPLHSLAIPPPNKWRAPSSPTMAQR